MPQGVTRRRFLAGAGAACAAAAAGPAGARPDAPAQADPGRDGADDLAAFVDETVEDALAEAGATGASVAVVRDGEVALTKGYGHPILDEDVAITDESLFQLGSTVKVVTWTAAMQAADRGLVDLDAPVADYLDDVPVDNPYDEPVTFPQLATHTAGFEGRVVGDTVRDLEHRRPLPETLAEDRPPVVRPPGELIGYTNYAAGLAGQAVADAAGTTYVEYVESELFEPLGMTDSTFDPAPDGLGAGPGECYFDEFGWYSDIEPASGMSATAADMGQFALALLTDGAGSDGRILSPAAAASMREQWYEPHEAVDGMAFGLSERTRGGTRYLSHTGGVPGFSTDLVLVPGQDLGLFVSVQGESPAAARSAIVEAFLDEYVPVDDANLEPDGRPTRADELRGTYRNVHGTDAETYNKLPMAALFGEVDVRVADDGALITESGGDEQRWVEVDPLVFRTPDGHETLAFLERGDDGEVTHLVNDGTHLAFERIGPAATFRNQGALAGVALAVALLSTLGWIGAGAWRKFGRGGELSADARRARWFAGGAAAWALALPFTIAAVGAIQAALGGPALWSRPPDWIAFAFATPVVAGVGTVAAGVYAVRAWYLRRWGLLARLHYTVVVLATGYLVWLYHYWRLTM